MKRKGFVLALCLLPGLAAAGAPGGVYEFPAKEVRGLSVDAAAGSVSVRGTTEDKITVYWLRDNEKLCDIRMEVKDGKLVITERMKSDHLDGNEKLGFSIMVPAALPVKVHASMGDVAISDMKAAETEIVSIGSVVLRSVSGKLRLRVDMGSLTGRDIASEDFNVKLSGKLELIGLKGPLHVEGGPWSTKLVWSQVPAAGDISISANGDVTMGFPETAQLSARLSTSGEIVNDFAAAPGGVPVSVNARTGNIYVRKYSNSKIMGLLK